MDKITRALEIIKKTLQWVLAPILVLGGLLFAAYTRYSTLIEKGRRKENDEKFNEIDQNVRDAELDAAAKRADWDAYAGGRHKGTDTKVQHRSGGPGQADRGSESEE